MKMCLSDYRFKEKVKFLLFVLSQKKKKTKKKTHISDAKSF